MPSGEATTLGRARLGFADTAEIDEFVATLERYERGELTPDRWRAFRLVRGTYGQRQAEDAQMLRVKIPQGVLDGPQLHALADVADTYSRGFGHVTTRQNVQFHFLKLHDVEHVMHRLAESGLTTREACGSAVRNVVACPDAGVAADELFDVTPYAEALTRFFLRHPLAAALPRKFKIAFEGCPTDHALTAINDLGWKARRNAAGERGWRVTVGGGTSILPRSGELLYDFLPAGELLEVTEAVLQVFHDRGDFKHKQRNRLKFLMRDMGFAAWRAAFEEARAAIRARGGIVLPFDPQRPPVEDAPAGRSAAPSTRDVSGRVSAARLRGPGLRPTLPVAGGPYERWRRTNVRPQKQAGFAIATATLPLGDVTGAQLRVLADLAEAYGDGTVRTTLEQDLALRWVRASDLPALHDRLVAAGLGLPDARTLADVTSCPGAETCRIAVTQSRGLGRLLGDWLRTRPDLVEAAPGLDVKISGCPNGCGQHHIAGLGFQGSVRRLGDSVLPQYFVMLGGGVPESGARFARLAAKIPARRVPQAVERLLALYVAERETGEPADAFFARVDLARVKPLLLDLESLDAADATAEDFVDLGEHSAFKLEALEGECSA
ncbi:MAG TPA: nitrite/sulfite reductase [Vicinamibacteria bacterium]|nr:nitrite/sulfite reductase [Vicinamibacteria bacterium]